MYRRDFLKLSGLFSAALVFPLNTSIQRMTRLPAVVQANGKIYRGSFDGNIEVSEDAGRSWHLHTRFGSQYSITKLSVDAHKRVIALIQYLGYDFQVALAAGSRAWRTM